MANGFGQTNFADALLFQQPQLGSLQGLFPGITDPSLTGGQPQFNPGLPQGAAPRTDFLGALELPAPGLAQAQVDSVQRLQKAAPQGIQAPPQLQDQAAPLGALLAREGLLAQLQQNQIGADAAIPQTDSGFGPQGVAPTGFAPPRPPLPAFNAPEFTPVQGSIGALPPLQGLQGTQSLQGLQGTQQLRPIGQQVPGGQQGGGLVPFSGGAQQKTAAAPQQATRAAQGQPQQPPVTPGQLAGGLGGQIAGGAARDAIGGAIFGGAPAAPVILNAAPAAPTLLSAGGVSTGATAAAPGFAATALPVAGGIGAAATGLAQFEGAKEILSAINNKGINQSVLSAYKEDNLKNILKSYRLFDYFDYVIGSDNIYAGGKSELGLKLRGMINLKGEEILFVGDTLHDAAVAKQMEVNCVLLSAGHQAKEKLKVNGVTVLDDLKELKKLIFND